MPTFPIHQQATPTLHRCAAVIRWTQQPAYRVDVTGDGQARQQSGTPQSSDAGSQPRVDSQSRASPADISDLKNNTTKETKMELTYIKDGQVVIHLTTIHFAFGVFFLSWLFFYLRGRFQKPALTPPHVQDFPPRIRDGRRDTQNAQTVVLSKATLLPMDKSWELADDSLCTPTGFTLEEIRRLGRFPDYGLLSGVPHPTACSAGFEMEKASFRPFRPFRWKFHQNMALMKFEPDYWVELERSYAATMAARHELLEKHGDRILFHLPGSELACRELMEMVVQFVCRRYPRFFSLDPDHEVLRNGLLKTETDLVATHPLRVLFDNIPEDFALMLRNEHDGSYCLRAAVVCSSVGWDIAQHMGSPLRDIHAEVPDISKMAMSMDRYFARMATDQPIQRCSWTIEDWQALFSSPKAVKDWQRSAFAANPGALRPEDLKLRCDWQTLRRLPLSGAIVFNFKAVFTPLAELRHEPFIPALLLKVLQEGKENLVSYKVLDHVRDVAIPVLKAWAAEQVKEGVVPDNWDVRTLDENPFYPGWEERWHALQGF